MKKHLDWEKILRYLSGECTITEKIEVTKWMENDSENEEFIHFLELIWQMEPRKKRQIDADSAWERFQQNYFFDETPEVTSEDVPLKKTLQKVRTPVHKKHKSSGWIRFTVLAASILIVAVFSYKFTSYSLIADDQVLDREIEYRELRTEKGQRTRIILSDGSVIHLNGDSHLRIPKSFRPGEDRIVYLEGEAFFEITRDEEITFQVIAGETVTTVLGTRFNVRSYQEEPDVTVVVASGMVSLGYLNDTASEPAILTNNQKGVISRGEQPSISYVEDIKIYYGWTEGELIFEQESLPKMINKLERWFGIDIDMRDLEEGGAGKRLTASFSERQPVEDVLQSISLVLDLSIEKTDRSANAYKLLNKQ